MVKPIIKRINIFRKKDLANKQQVQMAASPYADMHSIASLNTGLKGRWKYSPLFLHPNADTTIVLTGSRIKDYKLAEVKVGMIHIPGVSVWHHVWEKNQDGECRMQLVDVDLHKASCPHAGGCKLWSIENGMAYRSYGNVYVSNYLQGKIINGKTVCRVGDIRTGVVSRPYSDLVIDYIFRDEEKNLIQGRIYKVKNGHSNIKSLKPWGMDPYGNIFYSDLNGILFF